SDKTQPAPEELAKQFKHLSVESTTYEDFGHTFIRNALQEAAQLIEARKTKNDLVIEIPVLVRIHGFQGPPVEKPAIDPNKLDLQYELCASSENTKGFWACYTNHPYRVTAKPPR